MVANPKSVSLKIKAQALGMILANRIRKYGRSDLATTIIVGLLDEATPQQILESMQAVKESARLLGLLGRNDHASLDRLISAATELVK